MLWERIAEALLEDNDSILYVSRMEDYQLQYMNRQARLEAGLNEDDTSYEGQLCYKLLHGFDEPCKFCKRSVINKQAFFRWNYLHEPDGMHYWIKEKIITVEGVDCHLQLAMHITEQLEKERKIQRELEKERVLLQCVKTLEADAHAKNPLDSLLEIVARYFNGDRAYLFEFDYEKQVTNNTYEWAAAGVEKEIDILQNVPLSVIQTWIDAFAQVGSFYISDLDEEVDKGSDTYRILEMQGIHSLIAVPLEKDGHIIGFFGVDNPRKNYEDISLMSAITFFILNALDKRAYQAMLEKLSYEDTLTGLYNRNKFNHVFDQMAAKPPHQLGIVYADLNNLKVTNDNFGHDAGDQLIQTAARIIREVFGENTYRIGGDEFVAFLTDADEEQLKAMIQQMNQLMAEHEANASVGYSYRAENANIVEQLEEADNAMYAEKKLYRKTHITR
ncbi:MAG: sensor domain-containing diguanylate cyclase [Clostridiales bacterium]|nr:sensor domain-containing diguanylate cyclase [Clostridiales bacterium]